MFVFKIGKRRNFFIIELIGKEIRNFWDKNIDRIVSFTGCEKKESSEISFTPVGVRFGDALLYNCEYTLLVSVAEDAVGLEIICDGLPGEQIKVKNITVLPDVLDFYDEDITSLINRLRPESASEEARNILEKQFPEKLKKFDKITEKELFQRLGVKYEVPETGQSVRKVFGRGPAQAIYETIFKNYKSMSELSNFGENGYANCADIEIIDTFICLVADCLVMPETTVRSKIEDLRSFYGKRNGDDRLICVINDVIKALSDVFDQPADKVRYRLLDLGYEEARNALKVKDGKTVTPYIQKTPEVIYSFSHSEADKLGLLSNQGIMAKVGGKRMFFEGSHIFIDDSRFIEHGEKGITVKKEALQNIELACIGVKPVKYVNDVSPLDEYIGFLPSYKAHKFEKVCAKFERMERPESEIVYGGNTLISVQSEEKRQKKEIRQWDKTVGMHFSSLADAVRFLRKRKGLTSADASELCHINQKTLLAIESGRNTSPKLTTLVCICKGLEAPPMYANLVIRLGGYDLRTAVKKDRYLYLAVMDGKSLDETDKWLSAHIGGIIDRRSPKKGRS
ncbi:MAG: helix-turn-helix domain-containing protein [Eubacteriales bacterium]